MKKKLLSLVLAGAMVASTSVSAFATTTTTHEVGENKEAEHQVTVNGNIANSTDHILPGTISVTIPTAVSFTINNKGKIDSGNINITSNSEDKVDIIAYQFIDPTKDSKITVVPANELVNKSNSSSDTNRYISLSITGGTKEVGLKSADGTTTGILKDDGSEYQLIEKPVLGTVNQSTPLNLKISGTAATSSTTQNYEAPTNAVREEFKLILKIQKTR